MASDPIPKINNNNEIIGVTTITEARENGWPRRVTRIFIFNEKNELLLQKRSDEARIYPNLWDCSGGHVDVDESYVEAGSREVKEELGIDVEVREISEPVFYEDTFYVACKAVISSDTKFILKLDEIVETQWMQIDDFSNAVAVDPESYTAWTVHAWTNLKDKLVQ